MSKKIRWLNIALNDLDTVVEYISQHNTNAARKLANRIWKTVQILAEHPNSGRMGRVSGTRELVVSGTSYIIPYRIKNNEIQILRVLHGARKWPTNFYRQD